MKKKTGLLVFILILLAAAGTVVHLRFFRALPVTVLALERDVPIQVFGLGTVEARITSKVGFKVPGILVELEADQGDLVEAGGRLAGLDDREQKSRAAKAETGVDRAKAGLEAAGAKAAKVRITLDQQKQVSRRRQALLQRNIVAVEEAQEAETAYESVRAELAQAESEIEAAEAALKDAQAQAALERVVLAQHQMSAPYQALVVTRHKELGAVVMAGEPVFTLVDPETIWVLAYVDEEQAGELRPGQLGRVTLRSQPHQTFPARVARIDLESDRVNEERRVWLAWNHRPDKLFLGEQAEVVIETARLAQAWLVPQTEVDHYTGSTGQVFTVEDGRLQRREVRFGHRTVDGRLEIVSGLPEGAKVVGQRRIGLRVGRRAAVEGVYQP